MSTFLTVLLLSYGVAPAFANPSAARESAEIVLDASELVATTGFTGLEKSIVRVDLQVGSDKCRLGVSDQVATVAPGSCRFFYAIPDSTSLATLYLYDDLTGAKAVREVAIRLSKSAAMPPQPVAKAAATVPIKDVKAGEVAFRVDQGEWTLGKVTAGVLTADDKDYGEKLLSLWLAGKLGEHLWVRQSLSGRSKTDLLFDLQLTTPAAPLPATGSSAGAFQFTDKASLGVAEAVMLDLRLKFPKAGGVTLDVLPFGSTDCSVEVTAGQELALASSGVCSTVASALRVDGAKVKVDFQAPKDGNVVPPAESMNVNVAAPLGALQKRLVYQAAPGRFTIHSIGGESRGAIRTGTGLWGAVDIDATGVMKAVGLTAELAIEQLQRREEEYEQAVAELAKAEAALNAVAAGSAVNLKTQVQARAAAWIATGGSPPTLPALNASVGAEIAKISPPMLASADTYNAAAGRVDTARSNLSNTGVVLRVRDAGSSFVDHAFTLQVPDAIRAAVQPARVLALGDLWKPWTVELPAPGTVELVDSGRVVCSARTVVSGSSIQATFDATARAAGVAPCPGLLGLTSTVPFDIRLDGAVIGTLRLEGVDERYEETVYDEGARPELGEWMVRRMATLDAAMVRTLTNAGRKAADARAAVSTGFAPNAGGVVYVDGRWHDGAQAQLLWDHWWDAPPIVENPFVVRGGGDEIVFHRANALPRWCEARPTDRAAWNKYIDPLYVVCIDTSLGDIDTRVSTGMPFIFPNQPIAVVLRTAEGEQMGVSLGGGIGFYDGVQDPEDPIHAADTGEQTATAAGSTVDSSLSRWYFAPRRPPDVVPVTLSSGDTADRKFTPIELSVRPVYSSAIRVGMGVQWAPGNKGYATVAEGGKNIVQSYRDVILPEIVVGYSTAFGRRPREDVFPRLTNPDVVQRLGWYGGIGVMSAGGRVWEGDASDLEFLTSVYTGLEFEIAPAADIVLAASFRRGETLLGVDVGDAVATAGDVPTAITFHPGVAVLFNFSPKFFRFAATYPAKLTTTPEAAATEP